MITLAEAYIQVGVSHDESHDESHDLMMTLSFADMAAQNRLTHDNYALSPALLPTNVIPLSCTLYTVCHVIMMWYVMYRTL